MSNQVLYRFYDAQDRLLYVGITNNFLNRVGQHGSDKEWFTQIVRSTLEHFPTREAVEAAETAAIRKEKPLHNKLKQPDYVPADYHAKTIEAGTVYTTNRFRGKHEWIKPYVASFRFPAQKIKDPLTRRIWLVAKAYEAAKVDGYWCRSCESLLNHKRLGRVSTAKKKK